MLILTLATLLTGCSKEEPCDSSKFVCDTAAFWDKKKAKKAVVDPTDGTWIDVVRMPGCAGAPDTFSVAIRVRGATNGSSRVDIWSDEELGSGFNESHPLAPIAAGTDFEELLVELRDEASPTEYQGGQRTTYVCGVDDVSGGLTYAVRVYDEAGRYADCAVFSTATNPQAAIDKALAGDLPEPNDIRDRSELTDGTCRSWTLSPPS